MSNVIIKLMGLSVLPFILTACSGGDGDDLDKFMEDAPKTMTKTVAPLPQVQPYIPLQFNADGTLSDPFKPRKVAGSGSFQPDTSRPKEPMESYSLENLKYVGALTKNKVTYALIKTPDNTINQIKIGNYVGTNYGLVTAIDENEITVKEIIQDDLSGDWVERISSLSLQE
jgi:type IV pilus assembly protein PilP